MNVSLQPLETPPQDTLRPLLKEIEARSVEALKTSNIALPTIKHWLNDLKTEPPLKSACQILTLPVYATLVGLGVLTSYSSLTLLANSNPSLALSPNIIVRVNFANNITNSGALFACITDFPAITYVFFLCVFNKAHKKAEHAALNQVYLSSSRKRP